MKTVLVADDHETVRKTLRRCLERLPVNVQEAEDGEQALELVLGGAFDLVISDYQMPGLDGLELIARCRQQHPQLPFILISGAEPENAGRHEDLYFLKKPFRMADLASLVRFILGA
jgi:CheY-like chemotaxis protein